MAIYYPSATDQRDGSAPPFLQEQLSSTSYDELSIPSGNLMMYMNQSAPSSSYMEFMSEHSLSQHECVDMAAVEGSRDGLPNIPTGDLFNNAVDDSGRKIPRMQINMVNTTGDQNVYNQGLSLSLSTEIQSGMAAPSHYQYSSTGLDSFSHLPMSAEGTTFGNYLQFPTEFSGDYGRMFKHQVAYSPQLSMGPNYSQHDPNMYNSFHTKTICDSKFLKAAQQLLDEVVNVQDALKKSEIDKTRNSHQTGTDKEAADKSSESANLVQSEASSSDISSTVRQELLNKKSKLMSMLDEVDRRFSQYYHQMHAIVSSFDAVAGPGSAKPYTKLALQAISRHFRSVRDAIVGQIQATRKNLGEQDTSPNLLGGGIPRLRYVDQQIRQQRGFHPLGVSRHSWRPQRGLPESSVTVLRAWLFEHFLHPYPKESEKVMLARQTGLTRGQVANWFINARVRLWKPMVEEMYKEEFGESDVISISSPDRSRSSTALKTTDNAWGSIEQAGMSSTGALADFFQNRSHGDEDELVFGLMKFEGDRRSDNSLDHHHHHNHGLYHSELVSLNQEGDGSSLAQDNQVSLGLGVTRP